MSPRISLAISLAVLSLSVVAAAAPETPQNLVANVSGNNVTLAWQAPFSGSLADVYIVEASLSPGGAVIATLPTTATTLTVTAVPNGVYYVRVRGTNAQGSSLSSNEVVVAVPSGGGGGCSTAPTAPTNFTASASGNQVTLLWAAPIGGCPATSYVVQAGAAPGLSNLAVVNVGGATSLSASAPAGTYYIRVLALNAFGSSATSDTILTIGAAPAPAM
jgi:predicted phage tail protein